MSCCVGLDQIMTIFSL